jgi:hypothetical protein
VAVETEVTEMDAWEFAQINGREDDDEPQSFDLLDPFVPDWDAAPTDAEWHTVDEDGAGRWWVDVPSDIVEPSSDCGIWWSDKEPQNEAAATVDMFGCDWRNSLRHRPQVQP